MHRLFADWYKQADLSPTTEVLNARWLGVEGYLKTLDRNAVLQLTRVCFSLPKPDAAGSEIEGLANAFKEADVGFPMKDNENLLRVLAGVVLAQCIESKHRHAGFAALSVVSAGCRGIRSMPSIVELPAIAQQYLQKEGQLARENDLSGAVRIPKFSKMDVPNAATFEIQDAPNQNHWPQVNQNFQNLRTWMGQVSTAIQALSAGLTSTRNEISASFTANAERANLESHITVLKEECDVLWWLFGEFSDGPKLSWKESEAKAMCLLIGQELADLYAYYTPAPNTEAFLVKALSVMAQPDGKLSLQTVISSAPLEWGRTLSQRMKSAADRSAAVTPFYSALLRRVEGATGSSNDGQPKSTARLTATECGYQMLIETLLLDLLEAKNA